MGYAHYSDEAKRARELKRLLPKVKHVYKTTGETSGRATIVIGLLSISAIPTAILVSFSAFLLIMPIGSFFPSLSRYFGFTFFGTLLSLVVVGIPILAGVIGGIVVFMLVCHKISRVMNNRNRLVPLLFGIIGCYLGSILTSRLLFIISPIPDGKTPTDSVSGLNAEIFSQLVFTLLYSVFMTIAVIISFQDVAPLCQMCKEEMINHEYLVKLDPAVRGIVTERNVRKLIGEAGHVIDAFLPVSDEKERCRIMLWSCKTCHTGYVDAFAEVGKAQDPRRIKWLIASQTLEQAE